MGVISQFGWGLLLALAVSLVVAEIKAINRVVVGWLVARAAGTLPEAECARFKEEWEAHLLDIESPTRRIIEAVSLMAKADAIANELADKNINNEIVRSTAAIPLRVIAGVMFFIESLIFYPYVLFLAIATRRNPSQWVHFTRIDGSKVECASLRWASSTDPKWLREVHQFARISGIESHPAYMSIAGGHITFQDLSALQSLLNTSDLQEDTCISRIIRALSCLKGWRLFAGLSCSCIAIIAFSLLPFVATIWALSMINTYLWAYASAVLIGISSLYLHRLRKTRP